MAKATTKDVELKKLQSKSGQHDLLDDSYNRRMTVESDDEMLPPKLRFKSFMEARRISSRPFTIIGPTDSDILHFKEESFDVESHDNNDLMAIPILPADEMDTLTSEIKQWNQNRRFFHITVGFVMLCQLALLAGTAVLNYWWYEDRFIPPNSSEISASTSETSYMHYTTHGCGQIVNLCLMSFGFLVFRLLPHMKMTKAIALHSIISAMSFGICVVSVYLAFIVHYEYTRHENHFYSSHSWTGLAAVVLYVITMLSGVLILYYPSPIVRMLHSPIGFMTFFLCGVTSVTGLLTRAIIQLGPAYKSQAESGTLANCCALVIVMMTVAARLGVVNFLFRRRPKPQWDVMVFRSMEQVENIFIEVHYMYDSFELWVKEVNETKVGAVKAPSSLSKG